jgi:hypothetical protein
MRRRTIKPKVPEKVEQTMQRLERYCAEARGRQTKVAKALCLHPSRVAVWIARGGVPRLEKFCELIDFLDQQVPTERKTQ